MLKRLRCLLRPTSYFAASSEPPAGERLVFVGGAPRSGTTLVQHMLDSHPDIFGGPEYDCIPTIARAWAEVIDTHRRGRIKAYGSRVQIDAAFAALVENLLLPAADAAGARLVSEKTPFNVMVFGHLLEFLPACRVMFVVRDPRSVVSSLLQVGRRAADMGEQTPEFTRDVGLAIKLVRESLDGGFHAAHVAPKRVLVVQYTSLVTHPDPEARRLCDFLGLPYAKAMVQPHEQTHPDQNALLNEDRGVWVDPSLGYRPIETSRVRAWENDLVPEDAARVGAAFRDDPNLAALGYRFD